MSTTSIADHALLSDCHSGALVNTAGSVEWLCFPRFDSASTFAGLLDDAAGHWSIAPVGDATVTRRYIERTMVLETTFRTPTGAVAVTDALCLGPGNRNHDLGKGSPHLLVRQVVGLEGEVEIDVEFAPRMEYGLIHPLL